MLNCRYCSKQYKNTSLKRYENHLLTCSERYNKEEYDNKEKYNKQESNNKEKYNKQENCSYEENVLVNKICQRDDNMEIVSPKELQKILFIYVKKVHTLENEIDKLKAEASVRKRKINILNWLNENKKCDITFTKFIDKIELDNDHLELLFQHGYIQGIVNIIKLFISRKMTSIPICAFGQKDNTLYIFNEEWCEMSNEVLKKLINKITKQISILFNIWNKNNTKISEKEQAEILDKTSLALGHNISQDEIYTKTHKSLYKNLKIDIKTIIEYDFEF